MSAIGFVLMLDAVFEQPVGCHQPLEAFDLLTPERAEIGPLNKVVAVVFLLEVPFALVFPGVHMKIPGQF